MLSRRNPPQGGHSLYRRIPARESVRAFLTLALLFAAAALTAVTGCRKSEDAPSATDQAGNPAPKAMTPAAQAAIQRADQQGPAIHAANAAPGGN